MQMGIRNPFPVRASAITSPWPRRWPRRGPLSARRHCAGADWCRRTAPARRRTASPSPKSSVAPRRRSVSRTGRWWRAKCYLGHSIGAAAGDQISTTLGIWQHGILPGITTIDSIAADVRQEHLSFSNTHREIDSTRTALCHHQFQGLRRQQRLGDPAESGHDAAHAADPLLRAGMEKLGAGQ